MAMKASEIDLFIIQNRHNMSYFTGITNISGYLYIGLTGKPRFYPVNLQREQALLSKPDGVIIPEEPNSEDALRSQLLREAKGAKNIACDELSLSFYRKFISCLNVEPKHGEAILANIMRHYDEEEITFVRRAAEIIDAGFKAARETIRPGITELEVLGQMQYTMRKMGSEWDLWMVFGSGPNSAFSEALPTNRIIERGDMLFIDIGPVYKGYPADISRTFMVGKPTSAQRHILDSLLEVEMKTVDMVKAGVNAGELDAAVRRLVRNCGFKEYKHHTGHALNHSFRIVPDSIVELEVGDVICLEPGIYEIGLGGGRIEDEMIVKEGGVELLTHAVRDPYLYF
jgi:Xaa-Pro aminopeptidase